MFASVIDTHKANLEYSILCGSVSGYQNAINQGKTGYCWLISALDVMLDDCCKEIEFSNINFQHLVYWDKFERCLDFFSVLTACVHSNRYDGLEDIIRNFRLSDEGQWSMAVNIVNKHGIYLANEDSLIDDINTTELNAILNYSLKGFAIFILQNKIQERQFSKLCNTYMKKVELVLNSYLPQAFCSGVKVLNSFNASNYSSVFSTSSKEIAYRSGYRVRTQNNMIGNLPSVHFNLEEKDFYEIINKQLKNKKKVWLSCDAGKFVLWKKGIFDDSLFNISRLFPELVGFTRAEIKKASMAGMCHAMLIISRVDDYFLVKNTKGAEFGKNGYGIMSRSWFEKFIFQAIVATKDIEELIKDSRIYDIPEAQFYRNV